ncbi:MAG: (2Fe-2S) ferredoxin domain-containing protein [Magnetococcales bacterium]|nr:(2Fe-2S) ferredoxin domain-containing protein [Magnetococcales bacterium]
MMEHKPVTVVACIKERVAGSSCAERGGVALADAVEQELARQGLPIGVKRILCLGQCEQGPNLRIAPGGAFFHRMTMDRLGEVVEAARAAYETARDQAP